MYIYHFCLFHMHRNKNCTCSVNCNYTWMGSPSLNMSRGKQSDDFFLCNYLYRPVYARFIIKVSRVEFFVFIESMLVGKWLVSKRRSFAAVIPRIHTSCMVWVLTTCNLCTNQSFYLIKYMTFKTKNKPESLDLVYCTTIMLHK